MYDVTAGHEGYRLVAGEALAPAEVITDHALDLDPYADGELTDAELLDHAYLELAAAEVPVLGAGHTIEGDTRLDEVLAAFDTHRHAYPADQLAVRRTRRRVNAALRQIGGAA